MCHIKDKMKDMHTTHPFFLKIRALRNLYYADMVGLIVSNSVHTCGCGSMPSNWSGSTDEEAYFTTSVECSADNLSFAHELGHAFVSQLFDVVIFFVMLDFIFVSLLSNFKTNIA
jgi:hypothetical protein